jgi:hypothetical protein
MGRQNVEGSTGWEGAMGRGDALPNTGLRPIYTTVRQDTYLIQFAMHNGVCGHIIYHCCAPSLEFGMQGFRDHMQRFGLRVQSGPTDGTREGQPAGR